MTRHHDGVVSDAEEVQLDAGQQAELVRVLRLELLCCLEPVHELRHLLVAEVAVRPGVDAVHHLHLRAHQRVIVCVCRCINVVLNVVSTLSPSIQVDLYTLYCYHVSRYHSHF